MTTIGRYEIREQIGTGSMGTVYRARDIQLDREVALKTIRTGMDVEPEIRERFFREARACARLQHPSIITVYDLGEDKSVAYIAMELLRGSDFRQLIQGDEKVALTVKLEVMVQICEALGHAHRNGIIHRDVKPSNLFLVNRRQAKVLDFGIARLTSSHLTLAGKILGTPNYMSPEQILGKQADAHADLFSAAIVFFELLVHAHPFQGKSIPKRIVESAPDSLLGHDPLLPLPSQFEKIFIRALAKDSSDRYHSGDEFAEDLRALLVAVGQNATPASSDSAPPAAGGEASTRGRAAMDWSFPAAAAIGRSQPDPVAPRGLIAPEPLRDDATQLFAPLAPRLVIPEIGPVAEFRETPLAAPESTPAAAPKRTLLQLDPWVAELNAYAAGLSRNRIAVAAGVLLSIIGLGVVLMVSRRVPVAPAVATAIVSAPQAAIHERRSADSRTVAFLGARDKVSVLRVPVTPDQEWVQVQYVAPQGRVFRPGYMRVGDLGDWDSLRPPTALSLIRVFHVDRAETGPQIDSSIGVLHQFVVRFAGNPAVLEARLLMAEMEIRAALQLQTAGTPPDVWSARLDLARTDILAASHAPALRERASELREQVDGLSEQPLRTPPPPPSLPPPVQVQPAPAFAPPAAPLISELLEQAEHYRHDHNFDAAEAIVKRILTRDPHDARAQQLLDAINESRTFFK
jgi:hypothetical protein